MVRVLGRGKDPLAVLAVAISLIALAGCAPATPEAVRTGGNDGGFLDGLGMDRTQYRVVAAEYSSLGSPRPGGFWLAAGFSQGVREGDYVFQGGTPVLPERATAVVTSVNSETSWCAWLPSAFPAHLGRPRHGVVVIPVPGTIVVDESPFRGVREEPPSVDELDHLVSETKWGDAEELVRSMDSDQASLRAAAIAKCMSVRAFLKDEKVIGAITRHLGDTAPTSSSRFREVRDAAANALNKAAVKRWCALTWARKLDETGQERFVSEVVRRATEGPRKMTDEEYIESLRRVDEEYLKSLRKAVKHDKRPTDGE